MGNWTMSRTQIRRRQACPLQLAGPFAGLGLAAAAICAITGSSTGPGLIAILAAAFASVAPLTLSVGATLLHDMAVRPDSAPRHSSRRPHDDWS